MVTLAYPLHPPARIPAALPQDPKKVEYPGNKDLTKPLVSTQVPAAGEAARPTYGQRCLNPLHIGAPLRELPVASGLSWPAQVPQGPEADGSSQILIIHPPRASDRPSLRQSWSVCLTLEREQGKEGGRPASPPTRGLGDVPEPTPRNVLVFGKRGPAALELVLF